MLSFSSLATLSLFAVGSLGVPFGGEVNKRQSGFCLSDSDAQLIATNYGKLIELVDGWEDIANAALAPNFIDYSESVNTLINTCPQGSNAVSLPLMNPTFSSRTQFEGGQGQQAPINFIQLNLWHSCDTVIIRWETTNTANITNVKPVAGIITLETAPAPTGNQYPYYIHTVYSEFDAGAWLQNIQEAGLCPSSTSGASGPSGSSAPAGPH